MRFKSLLGSFKQIANGRLYRLVLAGCYLMAFLYLLIVALMIWKGDTWAYIIYAENPYAHLAGGLIFLLLALILRKGDSYTSRDWKLLIAKCVMLCFSLGMAFLIGEIGLRMILIKQQEAGSINRLRELKEGKKKIPIRSSHPLAAIIELSENMDLVYELRPNMDMQFGDNALRTNSRGMRSDREYTDEKPSGTFRIIGLGDSGMFGWNVEQGEEYMAVLEQVLNKRDDGINYEVMNLAVPGYNTALEAESLVYKGLSLDPDIVVVGWCENDYQLPFFMLERIDFTRKDVSFLLTYVFNRKEIIELVGGRKVKSKRNYTHEMVEEETRSRSGKEGVRKSFTQLRDLSKKEGFKLIVLGPLHDDIQKILRDVGIHFYNTYLIHGADYPSHYAIHFMHPRPGGHAVIAEKFAENLASRGWLTLSDGKR